VDLWPETGRRHQIRKHLNWLGHAIVGDVRYGGTLPERCIKTALNRMVHDCVCGPWKLPYRILRPSTPRRLKQLRRRQQRRRCCRNVQPCMFVWTIRNGWIKLSIIVMKDQRITRIFFNLQEGMSVNCRVLIRFQNYDIANHHNLINHEIAR